MSKMKSTWIAATILTALPFTSSQSEPLRKPASDTQACYALAAGNFLLGQHSILRNDIALQQRQTIKKLADEKPGIGKTQYRRSLQWLSIIKKLNQKNATAPKYSMVEQKRAADQDTGQSADQIPDRAVTIGFPQQLIKFERDQYFFYGNMQSMTVRINLEQPDIAFQDGVAHVKIIFPVDPDEKVFLADSGLMSFIPLSKINPDISGLRFSIDLDYQIVQGSQKAVVPSEGVVDMHFQLATDMFHCMEGYQEAHAPLKGSNLRLANNGPSPAG